jgi:hypothetical protein
MLSRLHVPQNGIVVFYGFCAILSFTLILGPRCFLPSVQGAGGDVAVVVRPDTPADSLTLTETRKLLLGEQQFWNPRLRVTLLLLAPTAPERAVVLRVIYRMNEAEFRQYWISKMFRADVVDGPKVVLSNEVAMELVSALPGSVAFVDATQVPKGLKVLKIDGKLPGQLGYPLK